MGSSRRKRTVPLPDGAGWRLRCVPVGDLLIINPCSRSAGLAEALMRRTPLMTAAAGTLPRTNLAQRGVLANACPEDLLHEEGRQRTVRSRNESWRR